MSKLIYLDNAATTKTAPEVLEAMLPYFTEQYGNPSAIYSFASHNKDVVAEQRERIANALGAKSNEIYFTAGGSESDNWALKATAEAYQNKGKHIITTKIEHHAILHTAAYLEERGFEVTYLDVDEYGKVNPADVEAAIRPDTILISVMYANNEIGTIEPIKEIGEIAHKHGILFHTDAVQAFGQVPINVDECHIDMLSASGTQAERTKRNRIPLYQKRREDPFLCSWWGTGKKTSCRYRKCSGYCWNRYSNKTCYRYDGRTYSKRARDERLSDQTCDGRNPVHQAERTSDRPSAK